MNNQTIEDLQNRKLNPCYFSILCISTKIYFKESDGNINQKDLYTFYACSLQGVRKFISCVISNDFSKTSDWYDFLLQLKNRGIEIVLYANIPCNHHLKDALLLAFEKIEIFYSCFEPINKIFKYYTRSYSTNVFKIIKDIYLSESIDDYKLKLTTFYDEFGSIEFLLDLLEKDLKDAKKYYEYNFILRKHIFSFYFYRESIKKYDVISHSKDYFSSINEYIELLIPIIMITEKKMYCSRKEWINVINCIYPIKKDLIKCYL